MVGAILSSLSMALFAAGPIPATAAMADAAKPAMPRQPSGRIVISEVVEPRHRQAVLAVMRKPTITTRGAFPEFVCTPTIYNWLLDHPDRVSIAWRRLKVACVEITEIGNGVFNWNDGNGSELTWRTVGRFPGGLIWYATGKVKASAITPTVPIRAAVVMLYPQRKRGDGTVSVSPAVHVYLQTDSKAAKVVLRLLGPSAPKLAEQGAEQLLLFFAGIARHLQRHPEKAETLLAPVKTASR